MAWFIGQSLAFIVVAFLLGLLVGWLIWARSTERAIDPPAAEAATSSPDTTADTKPVTTPDPTPNTTAAVVQEPAEAGQAVAVEEPVPAENPVEEPADADEASTPPAAPVLAERPAKSVRKPLKKATGGTPDDPELDEAVAAEVVAEAEAVARAAAEAKSAGTGDGPATEESAAVEAEGRPAEAAAEASAPAAQAPSAEVPEAGAPPAADAATAVEPDPEPQDLQRLEGIGPKIEAALRAAGITTYAKVAAATEAELREALKAAGITFAPAASSWSTQAEYLVDGDEKGLEEYQDYLVAGRDRARKFDKTVDYADVDEIEGEAAKAAALAQDDAEAAAAAEATEPEVQA